MNKLVSNDSKKYIVVDVQSNVQGGGSLSYPLLPPIGSSLAPPYSFQGYATSGVYRDSGGICVTTSGSKRMRVTDTQIELNTPVQYQGLEGQVLTIADGSGIVESQFTDVPARTILLRKDAYANHPQHASTLAQAVSKAKLLLPSLEDPVAIVCYPGAYVEFEAIVIDVDLIKIQAMNSYYVSRFTLQTSLPVGTPWITVSSQAWEMNALYLDGNENCDYVLKFTDNTANVGCDIDNFWILNARVSCLWIDGGLVYSNLALVSSGITTSSAVLLTNAGYFYSIICTIFPGTSTVIFFDLSGGSYLQLTNDIADGGSIFMKVDGSEVQLQNGIVSNMTLALELSNSAIVTSKNVIFRDNLTHNNAYDSSCLYVSQGDNIDMTALDMSTMTIQNTSLNFFNKDLNNNRGTKVFGTLSVGDRRFPSTSYFGEGSYNSSGWVVIRYDASINTNFNITSLVDQNSTTGTQIFNNDVNDILAIGDTHPFSALRFTMTSLITGVGLLTQATQCAYWDGANYITMNIMATNAKQPYGSNADDPFRVNLEEEMHLDITQLRTGSFWQPSEVDGITRYWMIIQPKVAGVVGPFIKSITNLYNTTTVRPDGSIAHYGLARTLKSMPFDVGSVKKLDTVIADHNVYFSTDIGAGRETNKLAKSRSIGTAFFTPSDLDTSSPIILKVAYTSDIATANQPVFKMQLKASAIGDKQLTYTSRPVGVTLANTTTVLADFPVLAGNGLALNVYDLSFYLTKLIPSTNLSTVTSMISFELDRLNTDTNGNNIVIVQLGIYYLSNRGTQISYIEKNFL